MYKYIVALLLLVGCFSNMQAQNTEFTNKIFPAQTATATGTLPSVALATSPSGNGGAFSIGSIVVSGTGLSTVTFGISVSKDGGQTYFPTNLWPQSSPSSLALTVTATTAGNYGFDLANVTNYEIVVSGTFTATSVKFVVGASPNGSAKNNNGGGGGGPPTGVAGGDLSGDYPNPNVAAVNGISFPTCATSGGIIYFNGTQYVCSTGFTIVGSVFSVPSFSLNGGTTQTGTQGTDVHLLTAGTVSGTSALLCTDANGGATTLSCPTGGGMVWPSIAGIANYSGSSSWGTSYNASNQIPFNFLNVGSIASQAANSVAITGGAINNTPIGGTTPSTGKFTSVVVGGGTPQTGTQGTDVHIMTAGTVSGSNAPLCTDANGGATTSGCPSSSNTINNAPQFSAPYYSAAGTTNTISGDTGATTDGAGNWVFVSEKTTGTAGVGGGNLYTEGTSTTCNTGGFDQIQASSSAHRLQVCNNGNNTPSNIILQSDLVSNITITVGASVAFAANTCSSYTGVANTASTTTFTGFTTSMTAYHYPTSDTKGVTGWGPSAGGQLYFAPGTPSAGSLVEYVCNATSSTITTGGSVTFNVSAK